jgi:hypothetical protein
MAEGGTRLRDVRRVSSFVQWSEPDFRGLNRKRRDTDGEPCIDAAEGVSGLDLY